MSVYKKRFDKDFTCNLIRKTRFPNVPRGAGGGGMGWAGFSLRPVIVGVRAPLPSHRLGGGVESGGGI